MWRGVTLIIRVIQKEERQNFGKGKKVAMEVINCQGNRTEVTGNVRKEQFLKEGREQKSIANIYDRVIGAGQQVNIVVLQFLITELKNKRILAGWERLLTDFSLVPLPSACVLYTCVKILVTTPVPYRYIYTIWLNKYIWAHNIPLYLMTVALLNRYMLLNILIHHVSKLYTF